MSTFRRPLLAAPAVPVPVARPLEPADVDACGSVLRAAFDLAHLTHSGDSPAARATASATTARLLAADFTRRFPGYPERD